MKLENGHTYQDYQESLPTKMKFGLKSKQDTNIFLDLKQIYVS